MKVHLKQWRLERFLTAEALAEKAGVACATIVRLERGHHKPAMRTIRKLAKALGVKPGQLVEWEPGDQAPNHSSV